MKMDKQLTNGAIWNHDNMRRTLILMKGCFISLLKTKPWEVICVVLVFRVYLGLKDRMFALELQEDSIISTMLILPWSFIEMCNQWKFYWTKISMPKYDILKYQESVPMFMRPKLSELSFYLHSFCLIKSKRKVIEYIYIYICKTHAIVHTWTHMHIHTHTIVNA